jgi:fatty acid CoA ligase FadD9
MLSLSASGVAPGSFHVREEDGSRAPAHYEGLPVDFIAEAISTLGSEPGNEFRTYNVSNPHDDGIGTDEFVDWLIDAGYPILRIDDYDEWLQRFKTALQALPERQRQASLLPLLHAYRRPSPPTPASTVRGERFRKAVQDRKIGPEHDIPT